MKKILILFLFIFVASSPANAGFIGKGELKLRSTAVNAFIKYIQTKDKPRLFLVPIDGSSASTWRCPRSVGACIPGGATTEIKKCEKYHKKECAIFAKRRTIKWANGINQGGKESRFNSKMTATEIKEKLKELGFLGAGVSISTTETTSTKKKKITKKSKKKYDNSVVQQLKNLEELYESGALTKEQFEKAKNKLLD